MTAPRPLPDPVKWIPRKRLSWRHLTRQYRHDKRLAMEQAAENAAWAARPAVVEAIWAIYKAYGIPSDRKLRPNAWPRLRLWSGPKLWRRA